MNWGGVILGIILTMVSYMIFPIILLCLNRGKFEAERARKFALWNSIVVGAFFCILTYATYQANYTAWNAAPAFLYYTINKAILTNKHAIDEEDIFEPTANISNSDTNCCTPIANTNEHPTTDGANNERVNDSETYENNSSQIVSPQTSGFCRRCGTRLLSYSIFCGVCGTKVIMPPKSND